MPTAILRNAEAFDFTTIDGERLELFGEMLSWSDEVKTGVVEKQVVRRAGALHQKMGAPPRKFSAKCVIIGGDVTARYRRLGEVRDYRRRCDGTVSTTMRRCAGAA